MSIGSDKEAIAPESLDFPAVCEGKFNSYIDVNYKSNDLDDNEIRKRNTELLARVQPTVQKQKENDKTNLERSVSTTHDYLMNKYSVNELKVEYNQLKLDWDAMEYDADLPAVEKPKNKPHYCDAIIRARKILIKSVPDWKENTVARIKREIKQRDQKSSQSIKDRLDQARAHPVHHLFISQDSNLSNAYSEKHTITISNQVSTLLSQESSGSSVYGDLGDLDLIL